MIGWRKKKKAITKVKNIKETDHLKKKKIMKSKRNKTDNIKIDFKWMEVDYLKEVKSVN